MDDHNGNTGRVLGLFRWTGTTDRLTLEVTHNKVRMAIQLAVLGVDVEPDEEHKIVDAVSRETPHPGSVQEFAIIKACRLLNRS